MNEKFFHYVMNAIFIILGICLILGKKEILAIFRRSAKMYKTNYDARQEKIISGLIWFIAIVFILGSTIKIITLFK